MDRNIQIEKMNHLLNDVCFIIGDCFKCFFVQQNKEIKSVKMDIAALSNHVGEQGNFIRINQDTIINTAHFVDIFKTFLVIASRYQGNGSEGF